MSSDWSSSTSTLAPSSSSWSTGPRGTPAPPRSVAGSPMTSMTYGGSSSWPSTIDPADAVLERGLGDDPDLAVELHRLGACRAQLLDGVEQRVDVDRPVDLLDRDPDAGAGDRARCRPGSPACRPRPGLLERRLRRWCRQRSSARVSSSRAISAWARWAAPARPFSTSIRSCSRSPGRCRPAGWPAPGSPRRSRTRQQHATTTWPADRGVRSRARRRRGSRPGALGPCAGARGSVVGFRHGRGASGSRRRWRRSGSRARRSRRSTAGRRRRAGRRGRRSRPRSPRC